MMIPGSPNKKESESVLQQKLLDEKRREIAAKNQDLPQNAFQQEKSASQENALNQAKAAIQEASQKEETTVVPDNFQKQEKSFGSFSAFRSAPPISPEKYEKSKKEVQAKKKESNQNSSTKIAEKETFFSQEHAEKYVSSSKWFLTICWMKIPIFGFIYSIYMACSKKTDPAKKTFARAYILYKVCVIVLSLTLLYVVYRVGLSFVDNMLSFVKNY